MEIIRDYSSSEYHKIKRTKEGEAYCSKSSLWKFMQDANEYRYGGDFELTQPMKLGSLLDATLLDPEELKFFYAKSDNPHLSYNKNGVGACRTQAAKDWAKAKEDAGYAEISDAERAMVEMGAKNVRSHPVAGELLRSSDYQIALFGKLEGVPFKGLLDLVPHEDSTFGDGIGDLKRTSQFHPNSFQYHVKNMGYDVQLSMYRDLWNAIQRETGGTDFRTCGYLLTSNAASPYGAGVVKLTEEYLDSKREWWMEALHKWRWCHEHDIFPTPYGDTLDAMAVFDGTNTKH